MSKKIEIVEYSTYNENDLVTDFGTKVIVNGNKLEHDLVLNPREAISDMLSFLEFKDIEVTFEEVDY